MSCKWLVVRLEAPLMAFGDILIDQVGPTRDYPAASMLTGIIANAFGWHWRDHSRHQELQDRLVYGARHETDGRVVTDTQNAQLGKLDRGWTTRGEPEGRTGASYGAPHRRFRDYHADLSVRVVLRLEPPAQQPTLECVAEALDSPARPLYIGRKPCLPSRPLLDPDDRRWVTADTAHAALAAVPGNGTKRAFWPLEQGSTTGEDMQPTVKDLQDLRNWRLGYHTGTRRVVEGTVNPVRSS